MRSGEGESGMTVRTGRAPDSAAELMQRAAGQKPASALLTRVSERRRLVSGQPLPPPPCSLFQLSVTGEGKR